MVAMMSADRDVPVRVESGLDGLRTGRGGVVSSDLHYLLLISGHQVDKASANDPQSLARLRAWLTRQPRAFLVAFADAPKALGPDFPVKELYRTRFSCASCTVPNDFVLYLWENPNAPSRQ